MTSQDSWHWEWCPVCGITGIVTRYADVQASTAPIVHETCECCDGLRRIKVPNGYELKQTGTYTITVSSGTWFTEQRDDAHR